MSDAAARAAALDIDRQILLQAPAGSGKTTVLAQRFLAALAASEEPEEVLAVTFTRKAAAEMRERVVLALEDALPSTRADRADWSPLRAAVLAQAAARGWSLGELPQRLRIQTIDSLCAEIARTMPLLGRMQTSLAVVDDATPLYREAARDTLREAEADPQSRGDVDLLLHRLHNNLDQAQALLANLLASRNRWQPWLLEHPDEELAGRVAGSLRRIVGSTLRQARELFPHDWSRDAARLAARSAQNRKNALHDDDGAWNAWLAPDAALDADPAALRSWQAVADLLLTSADETRKTINIRQGFPPTDRGLKKLWEDWRDIAAARPAMLALLRNIRALPGPQLDASEREALTALSRLMLLAAAQLKLAFRARGLVDHSEITAIARQALRGMHGEEGGSAGEGLRHALRISHLLVDEFQDTSPEQLELVEQLISGWDRGDRRSLFLVGDPMQSIYLFRDSEVGLFLRTRSRGVAHIRFEGLQLVRNFRSHGELVDWSNRVFAQVFPPVEDLRSSAVTFLPAETGAMRESTLGAEVCVWPQSDADPAAQARAIATEIARLRAIAPQASIAVLVQTRSIAGPILGALRAAGIPVVGVELAALADRLVVRELVALGEALLDAGDRSAWLAVLRAPAVGLTLADLLHLCEAVGPTPLVEHLEDPRMLALLSADGAARLARTGPVLLRAWRARGSQDIASLIEECWLQLGGESACRDSIELATARQYLLALRRLVEREGRVPPARLAELAARLRGRDEVAGANPVEVLTIHHAKGLEWDVVFVPGLGRAAAVDQPPLLRSLELPAPDGDTDLLLAVRSLGEGNSADPLARYITRLQSERQRNERLRLLYVAATRARHRLYLSGHAAPDKDGEPRPASRSLLALLWPAVREEFRAQQGEIAAAPLAQGPLKMLWRRLPAQFQLPAGAPPPDIESLTRAQAGEGAELVEFSWVGPLARASGTVMHAELERLQCSVQRDSPTSQRARVPAPQVCASRASRRHRLSAPRARSCNASP